MTTKELEGEIYRLKKFHNAKNAFLAGALDSWSIILEENPEMYHTVIKDMKEMATALKKSAGVIIFKE